MLETALELVNRRGKGGKKGKRKICRRSCDFRMLMRFLTCQHDDDANQSINLLVVG